MCEKNVGGVDRLARIVLGLALLVLMGLGVIGVWGWLGLIPLVTGSLGMCPLYRLFKISSCPAQKK